MRTTKEINSFFPETRQSASDRLNTIFEIKMHLKEAIHNTWAFLSTDQLFREDLFNIPGMQWMWDDIIKELDDAARVKGSYALFAKLIDAEQAARAFPGQDHPVVCACQSRAVAETVPLILKIESLLYVTYGKTRGFSGELDAVLDLANIFVREKAAAVQQKELEIYYDGKAEGV